jgi:hypothetical protein
VDSFTFPLLLRLEKRGFVPDLFVRDVNEKNCDSSTPSRVGSESKSGDRSRINDYPDYSGYSREGRNHD